jgi:hypothetical protein
VGPPNFCFFLPSSSSSSYSVFGWRATGAERSRSTPATVWMGSGGSGAAPEGIYPPDAGWLRPSKFGGRSRSAPVCIFRLNPVYPLSLSWCCRQARGGHGGPLLPPPKAMAALFSPPPEAMGPAPPRCVGGSSMAAYFSPTHPTPQSTPPQGRRSPRPAELATGGWRSSCSPPELAARTREAGPAGGGPRREEELARGKRPAELTRRGRSSRPARGRRGRQEEGQREELAGASRDVGKRMRMKRV